MPPRNCTHIILKEYRSHKRNFETDRDVRRSSDTHGSGAARHPRRDDRAPLRIEEDPAPGRDVHHKLRQVPYQDIAGLQALASDSAETLQGHLIATAIASRGETSEDMELHLEEEILVASPKITRMLWVLDTAVTIAPLLGLFGTIVGMIQAFSVLKDASGASKVTGGIADALISPIAVYFVNYFNTISREIMHQLDLIKLVLINHLHGKGGTAAPVARPVRMSVTHRE